MRLAILTAALILALTVITFLAMDLPGLLFQLRNIFAQPLGQFNQQTPLLNRLLVSHGQPRLIEIFLHSHSMG